MQILVERKISDPDQMFSLRAEPLIIAPITKGALFRGEIPVRLNLLDQFHCLLTELMKVLRSSRGLNFGIEGKVMPDEADLPDIIPFPFHPHMIESELPVGIDIPLGGKSARGLIVMDFDDGMIGKGYPVNETPDPITLLFIQREGNILFEAQGLSMIKGGVAVVIINDAFFSKPAIILRAVTFSNNLD